VHPRVKPEDMIRLKTSWPVVKSTWRPTTMCPRSTRAARSCGPFPREAGEPFPLLGSSEAGRPDFDSMCFVRAISGRVRISGHEHPGGGADHEQAAEGDEDLADQGGLVPGRTVVRGGLAGIGVMRG